MRCKVCDNTTKTLEDKAQKKIYHYCPNCQAIILDKSFIVDKNRENSQYNNHNNSFESSGYVKMFEDYLDYFWGDLKKHNKQNSLDFGSGPGPVLAQILQNRGINADIYDKFYQPNKIYENKKYNLITSTEVFEHLQNPFEILTIFKKHLKKGGLIAIMTLFHDNNKENFLKWWYRRDPTHILFYTPKTFEVLAKMCGLKILKHDDKRIIILT
ncbi:MAG: class I SAM-dependent methyltransferase [Epsilonproteobacteria bacterium]|nr:class I SAM-dependent methyltransferase [Campylobacterota bacterium]